MKANEAPERVYINPSDLLARNGYYAFTTKNDDNSVEYTRTDAFMDKAAEWIKNKADKYIVDTPLCSYFDYKRAVEDFKKYMKGE